MKIGLFFGSFNPVHNGHMIIANLVRSLTDLDQVWFVVSPHNPHKKKSTLANDYDRLHLVSLAIGDNHQLKASNIEFGLPQPSYTVDTLAYLKEKHPNYEFALIMGGDNLLSLPKWKNHRSIIDNYPIYVYDRPMSQPEETETIFHANITILEDLPLLHISSTYVRNCIRNGVSVQYLVPDSVFEYLDNGTMYH